MDMAGESESFVKSILGSVRTHLEDRLQSPFAGAFAIAWLAVNWKAVLILIFSDTTIEERIRVVSGSYFVTWNVIWWPLIYAAIGVATYYSIATAFLVAFEIYGMARRVVERQFDKHRWVSPESYIAFKKAMRKQVDDLSELASDHIERIEKLNAKVVNLELANRDMESKSQDQQVTTHTLISEKGLLETRLNEVDEEAHNLRRELNAVRSKSDEVRSALDVAVRSLDRAIPYVLARVEDPNNPPAKQTGLLGLWRPDSNADVTLLAELKNARKIAFESVGEF